MSNTLPLEGITELYASLGVEHFNPRFLKESAVATVNKLPSPIETAVVISVIGSGNNLNRNYEKERARYDEDAQRIAIGLCAQENVILKTGLCNIDSFPTQVLKHVKQIKSDFPTIGVTCWGSDAELESMVASEGKKLGNYKEQNDIILHTDTGHFAMRNPLVTLMADGLIAYEGSWGTLNELSGHYHMSYATSLIVKGTGGMTDHILSLAQTAKQSGKTGGDIMYSDDPLFRRQYLHTSDQINPLVTAVNYTIGKIKIKKSARQGQTEFTGMDGYRLLNGYQTLFVPHQGEFGAEKLLRTHSMKGRHIDQKVVYLLPSTIVENVFQEVAPPEEYQKMNPVARRLAFLNTTKQLKATFPNSICYDISQEKKVA